MPYITLDRREQLTISPIPVVAGELNYLISTMCIRYMRQGLSYQRINDVVGALENCKLEFSRRVIAKYEDKKISENGDLDWPLLQN